MKKRFPEIEKGMFGVRIPVDLVERLRDLADRKGWSLGRTVTEAMSIGMGIDPAEYGIDRPQEQSEYSLNPNQDLTPLTPKGFDE